MTLALGTRIGPYEITGRLGAGGMGEVYRARDARLNRDVALKVLPEAFALDGDRLARFRREAQVLASLNHPHIAAIYGLEEEGPADAGPDVRALVLELVEGQTLAELLAKGSPPTAQGLSQPESSAMSHGLSRGLAIDEALAIARQICDALDAAHDQGIIHRDLKPANIKVRPDGSVKVLDFGLAKATEAVTSTPLLLSMSPTVTSPAAVTGGGVILGTAAYMSPEQARGKLVDKRSDVWAFGCVLYEMLTGRRAFDGEDVTDTLSRVLQREPDFATLPPDTPQAVRKLLASCLQKDRQKRLPQIAVAAFQIDEALSGNSMSSRGAEPPTSERPLRRLMPAVIVACIASALVGAAAVWLSAPRATSAPSPVTRLVLGVTPAEEIGGNQGRPIRTAFALSPDGRTLVFSAVRANQRALYLRRFEQADATLIPGTEGGEGPFFSPDGRWMGFWAGGEIRKVPMAGGPPVRLSDAATPILGASWDQADRIVFAGVSGGLWEVPAAGGTPRTLTTVNRERGEVSHRLPHVLPGGDAIAYTITKSRFPRWDQTEIAVYSRRTGMSTVVVEGGADARYVSTGHLVFVREGVLFAAPFDLDRLDLTGGQVGVVADVMQSAYAQGQPIDSGAGQFTVSTTGTLVYVPGGTFPPAERSVLSIDRAGGSEVLPIQPRPFVTVRRSPDGQQIVMSTYGRDRDLWLYTLARGTMTKLPLPGRISIPIWTPDGTRIAFAASTSGLDALHWVRADGAGSPEPLLSGEQHLVAGTWTPGGEELIYYAIPSELSPNVTSTWVQNIVRKGMPTPVTGPAGGVDVSPDGHWIAYQAGGLNQAQIYVQAYPGPGPRYQVSADGGISPIWRADGRELFYARTGGLQTNLRAVDVRIMAVPVATQPTFTFGTPTQLFVGRFEMNSPARAYDITADGQRFFLLQSRERPPAVITQLVVVQNWSEELKRLAPTR
jgi:eukaryotic-like serine/threonine-protein kinase